MMVFAIFSIIMLACSHINTYYVERTDNVCIDNYLKQKDYCENSLPSEVRQCYNKIVKQCAREEWDERIMRRMRQK